MGEALLGKGKDHNRGHCTRWRGESWEMYEYVISTRIVLRLCRLRAIDGFIRASNENWGPSCVGGEDKFVLVENLAAKLETRTDPL